MTLTRLISWSYALKDATAILRCLSAGWSNNLHQREAFAQFVNIFQGKDTANNRLKFDDSFSGRALRRRENSAVMYSGDGAAWVLDTQYVTDSVAAAAFCGAGQGNSKRPFVGYGDARDDSISVTSSSRLNDKYNWKEKVCGASRFFELEQRARQCRTKLKIAVGVAFLESIACMPGPTRIGSPGVKKASASAHQL